MNLELDLEPEPMLPPMREGEGEGETMAGDVGGSGGESAIKILITRHSFSCNQEVMAKAPDPALTRKGINMAMDRAKYNHSGKRLYDSEIVLVSCLLRTWQTALLLYNPDVEGIRFSPKMIFTLCVYPHLKEHHKKIKVPLLGRTLEIDRGNHPTSLKLTLANFLKFLEFIRVNYSRYYTNYLPLQINIIVWNGGGSTLTFSLTRNGINENPFVVRINEEDCKGCWNSRDNNMIDPFLRQDSIFQEDGDLNVFVESIARLSDAEKLMLAPKPNGTVHVVAHSSLMRTYLNVLLTSSPPEAGVMDGPSLLDLNGRPMSFNKHDDKKTMINDNISETNMCSLELGVSEGRGTLNKVYFGQTIPPTQPDKNRDLCDAGTPGFLDPSLRPVDQREPEQDIYLPGIKVQITGTRTTANGKYGTIIGSYINGILIDPDQTDEIILGLTREKFKRIQQYKNDVIRVEYIDSIGESVRNNFSKENIHVLSQFNSETLTGNSVTLTLAGGGRLKKSKRKNKKTTKRKKNKKKSKRRKNTKRK